MGVYGSHKMCSRTQDSDIVVNILFLIQTNGERMSERRWMLSRDESVDIHIVYPPLEDMTKAGFFDVIFRYEFGLLWRVDICKGLIS